MITALFVAIWAGICGIDDMTTQMLRRPLPIATVVGIIMGDIQTALLIGATLEILWLGVGNVGAYSAPDMITGTAIGTALGIIAGGTATALAVAVPSSLLAQQLLILYRSGIVALNPIANRLAETGEFNKIFKINLIPILLAFLIRAVPTFIAVYLGANVITQVVESLPQTIIGGLGAAGKIIPSIGIALLMMMMLKKAELWVFLLAGFALAVYLKLSILAITLISLPLALLYDLAIQKETEVKRDTTEKIEEDYDL